MAVNFFGLRCDSRTSTNFSFLLHTFTDLFLPKIFTTSAYDFFSIFSKIFFFDVDHFLSHYRIYYDTASVLCFGFLVLRQVDLNSLTRDRIHTPCTGRQRSLNHWTTREVSMKASALWLLFGTPQFPVSPILPFGAIIKYNKVYLNSWDTWKLIW